MFLTSFAQRLAAESGEQRCEILMRGNGLQCRACMCGKGFWAEFIHVMCMSKAVESHAYERGCGAKRRAQCHRIYLPAVENKIALSV